MTVSVRICIRPSTLLPSITLYYPLLHVYFLYVHLNHLNYTNFDSRTITTITTTTNYYYYDY